MINTNTNAEMNRAELETAYAESHAFVMRYLEAIRDRIHDMPAPQNSGIAWDHVGTMNKIKSDLREIFRFLTGYDVEAD